MKKSISKRLFLFSISLIFIIMLISILSISMFSKDVYYNKKTNILYEHSLKIEKLIIENKNIELQDTISKIAWEIGGTIYILDEYGELEFFSINPGFQKGKGKGSGLGNFENFINLEENGKVVDKITGSGQEVLSYHIKLENNKYVVIQIPIQDISNTLDIVYEIFLYVFFISLIFAFLGSLIMAKYFTNPIKKLTYIAEKMAKLDFSVEYNENRNDEIGVLGEKLNILSRNLNYNIEKLSDELKKEKNMDKLRTQFVGQVSHELQTPLTIISGYVEALQDGMAKDKKETFEYYEIIADEINGMSRLIKELLDLSQLKSGKFSIEKEKYNIKNSFSSIVTRFNILSEKNDIEFIYEPPREDIFVYADKKRIEQVIRNILNNAFKNVFENGKIRFYTLPSNEKLKVVIFNEGFQIPKTEIPYIWNSFYKVEKNNEKKGTGLGLAINREILTLHNIEYGVKNLDDGVEFYFILNKVI